MKWGFGVLKFILLCISVKKKAAFAQHIPLKRALGHRSVRGIGANSARLQARGGAAPRRQRRDAEEARCSDSSGRSRGAHH